MVLAALLAVFFAGISLPADAATVRVTTWNLQWFPNGSPKEATPSKQEENIRRAADILRQLDPDIILLQEVHDGPVCQRLGEAIKPGAYHLAICSRFHSGGLPPQQVAILGKENAQAAWDEKWKSMEGVDPPRGFAFAWYKIRGAELGVYAVHLKSNLVMKGDHAIETAKNIRKREVAAEQVLEYTQTEIARRMPTIRTVIVGGDFNTNLDQEEFAAEKTIPILTAAGFRNCMEGLPLVQRVTHPGEGRYPDATFDYLFAKNAVPGPPKIVQTPASDHMPVTVDFTIVPGVNQPSVVSAPAGTKQPAVAPAVAAASPAVAAPAAQPPPSRSAPTASAASTKQASSGAVVVTRDTEVAIPYGTTSIRAGTRLEVVSRAGDQLKIVYLGNTHAIPAANTAPAPAGGQPAATPPALATAPAAPAVAASPAKSASTPTSPPAPANDLRNIKNVTVEQLSEQSESLTGQIVSVNFRMRMPKIEEEGDALRGTIVDLETVPGKKKKKTFDFPVQFPKEARAWFENVPEKATGEPGLLSHVFGRVTSGAKGKAYLELLGQEKRNETTGSRIVWTGGP